VLAYFEGCARVVQQPSVLGYFRRLLVEKAVDYFRESSQGIKLFPLAKNDSFLISNATLYLSINIG
jgi:hypothetical protein